MYYVLIDHSDDDWSAQGLDEFEFYDVEPGGDGPSLDRLKRRVFHAVQEANDGKAIIVKWVHTNPAHVLYRHLYNEHVSKPDEAGARLLADAGVTEDDGAD